LDNAGNLKDIIDDGVDLDLELDLSDNNKPQLSFDRPQESPEQLAYHTQYHL